MNKESLIVLCETYQQYRKIQNNILNALNILDDDDLGYIITPIKEALYIIIDKELMQVPEDMRDFIIDSIENFIWDGEIIISTGEEYNNIKENIYIRTWKEFWDVFYIE